MDIQNGAARGAQFIAEGYEQAKAAIAKLETTPSEFARDIEWALQTITTGERLLRASLYLASADTAKLPSERG